MEYVDPSEFKSIEELLELSHFSNNPVLLTDSDKHYTVIQSEVGYTKLLRRLATLDIELQDTVLIRIGDIIDTENGISPSTENIADILDLPSQLLYMVAECLEDRYGELFNDPDFAYLGFLPEGWDLYRKLKETNSIALDSISPF